ncbi:hypothetical protein, partial [uncultured Rikenella sp.]|uniref:hypothetical protein n=1 Tax=uncultured Rikenella sp. TaxID=368003 RepID=UPI0026303007
LAYSNSPPAVSATSSDELQSAAWGGGELRDPKGSQKHDQQFSPKLDPILGPVSASLRLRFRSAAFSRALRDSSIIRLPPK